MHNTGRSKINAIIIMSMSVKTSLSLTFILNFIERDVGAKMNAKWLKT